MLQRRLIHVTTMGVMLLVALPASPVPGAAWHSQIMACGHAPGLEACGQCAGGTTTTYVPQYEVVYKTVYDTECIQVPVTRMETRYRTEYQTKSVPVTR